MKRPVVYTAFSKGYDHLQPPAAHWRDAVDFVAFLEETLPTPGWEIRPLHQGFTDPCRNAKIHKILSHVYFPDQEYTMWVDGSISITTALSFAELAEIYLGDCDLAVFKHRRRQCVYLEALACLEQKKDDPEIIYRQVELYRSKKYPLNNGLIEGCVLLRRHTPQIRRFNEQWHDIITNYSRRDQLSFNYVAHQLNLKFRHFSGNYTKNPYFTYTPHCGHVPRKKRPASAAPAR